MKSRVAPATAPAVQAAPSEPVDTLTLRLYGVVIRCQGCGTPYPGDPWAPCAQCGRK